MCQVSGVRELRGKMLWVEVCELRCVASVIRGMYRVFVGVRFDV